MTTLNVHLSLCSQFLHLIQTLISRRNFQPFYCFKNLLFSFKITHFVTRCRLKYRSMITTMKLESIHVRVIRCVTQQELNRILGKILKMKKTKIKLEPQCRRIKRKQTILSAWVMILRSLQMFSYSLCFRCSKCKFLHSFIESIFKQENRQKFYQTYPMRFSLTSLSTSSFFFE